MVTERDVLETIDNNFEADRDGNSVGYLAFAEGPIKQTVYQGDQRRRLDYGLGGELLGIEFLDPKLVDLTRLPQDEIVPEQFTLYRYFYGEGYETITDTDLK